MAECRPTTLLGRMATTRARTPTPRDVEMRRLDVRAQVGTILAYGAVTVVGIAATAVPLLVVEQIVTKVAGKTTVVNFNFAFSITVGISLVMNVLQGVKGRIRRRTVEQLRGRITDLEGRLGVPPGG